MLWLFANAFLTIQQVDSKSLAMLQVLQNLQTYLTEEEEKMMKADAECK